MSRFSELAAALLAADGIAVYTHTNMDGDAAGSSAALCAVMRKLGKACCVVMEDEIPAYLAFLENAEEPMFINDPGFSADLAVAVDMGEEERLRSRKAAFHGAHFSVVIDHHEGTPDIGDLAVNAFDIMQKNKITSVVVMKEGRYVGLVHIHDILREGIV